MSQLESAEVNSGNRKAVFASNYATEGFVDAMAYCGNALCIKLFAQHAKQLNYTRTLIPFHTQSNAKVEVYVLQEVLCGCQSTKKSVRVTFLPSKCLISMA